VSIPEKKTELYVYDMMGKLQFSKSLETSSQQTAKVNFSEMAPGIYLVKMTVADTDYSIKIIKSQ